MRKYLGSSKTGLSVKEKLIIKEEAFNAEAEEEDAQEVVVVELHQK